MSTSTQLPRLFLCSLLSVLAAATGCVVGEDPGTDSPPDQVDQIDSLVPPTPGSTDACGYDAMSASTFYQQFAYRDRGGVVPYRLGATYEVNTALPNGDAAHLDVYMLANGRVIANYEERHGGGSYYQVVNKTVIVTRAIIDAASRKLTIFGVGSGTPATKIYDGNCVPGIDLTYSQNIRSTGLAGKPASIVAIWSSGYVIDPDDLQSVPSQTAREWFEEDVAAGVIRIVRP